jgi:signal transduction histidine kinase
MAEAHYRIGNTDSGAIYTGEAQHAMEAYNKEVISKNLSEAEKKYEAEENKRKIAELQRNELAAQLKITKQNNLLLALSVLLVGGGLMTAIFIQRFRAKKEREKATAVLSERDKGLKAIIDAQETERIRIARELHDGVGHKLLVLRMHIGSALAGDAAEEHKEDADVTNAILTEVMEEVRNASHQMMPKTLEVFGCTAAIEDLLEKTLAKAGIEYIFETHDVDKRYDTRIEITIYRIAQELISNVIKHANATSVYVHLMEAKQHLILLVEDNGKGIGEHIYQSGGIGMSTMKSRANAVNGEISIEAGKKSGTVARVKVPV